MQNCFPEGQEGNLENFISPCEAGPRSAATGGGKINAKRCGKAGAHTHKVPRRGAAVRPGLKKKQREHQAA